MKRIHYRIIDIFVLLTIVALVMGTYLTGFRVRTPLFLKGNFDSHVASETVGGVATWHRRPPKSIWERFFPSAHEEEYAIIGSSASVPRVVTKRILWLPIFYDILIATLGLLFAIAVAQGIQSAKRAA